jgi:hypothetical protein
MVVVDDKRGCDGLQAWFFWMMYAWLWWMISMVVVDD